LLSENAEGRCGTSEGSVSINSSMAAWSPLGEIGRSFSITYSRLVALNRSDLGRMNITLTNSVKQGEIQDFLSSANVEIGWGKI
jgi:hypothetical protein